ncbi:MAG: DUF5058 family protein [Acholeplasmataceae bacterium]|nr:DUF5058 family protein [Acholeplasmataceae bacterium]
MDTSLSFLSEWWVYVLAGLIFLYVIAQSVVFLLKARKRALSQGLSTSDLNRTMASSALFSIAPSIAILLGLLTLAKIFGPVISGLRLGILGAVTYELPAALNVIKGVYGLDVGAALEPRMVITALWVMTFGIIPSLVIIPLFFKKINLKMDAFKAKDKGWGQIMMDALFIGMISAFVGVVLAPKVPEEGEPYISVLAILTLLSSAALIMVMGLLIKKYKLDWLKNYALPISMIAAMGLAVLYAGLGVR